MKNFFKENGIFCVKYAYVDHKEYLADSLFCNEEIVVKYKNFFAVLRGTDYRVIFCKVAKKDSEKFEKALSKLGNKIALLGYSGYDEACEKFLKSLEN